MYFPLEEVMWYSSFEYQIRPYCDKPSCQVLLEKSSVNDVSDERVLLFELLFEFVFRFPLTFVFRFVLRLLLLFAFATRLLLSFVTSAITKIRTTKPMPRNTSTAPMPSCQAHTLRFCG